MHNKSMTDVGKVSEMTRLDALGCIVFSHGLLGDTEGLFGPSTPLGHAHTLTCAQEKFNQINADE